MILTDVSDPIHAHSSALFALNIEILLADVTKPEKSKILTLTWPLTSSVTSGSNFWPCTGSSRTRLSNGVWNLEIGPVVWEISGGALCPPPPQQNVLLTRPQRGEGKVKLQCLRFFLHTVIRPNVWLHACCQTNFQKSFFRLVHRTCALTRAWPGGGRLTPPLPNIRDSSKTNSAINVILGRPSHTTIWHRLWIFFWNPSEIFEIWSILWRHYTPLLVENWPNFAGLWKT